MNFLAHFHLSPSDADAITGAYLGDFVRGRIDDLIDMPAVMREGVRLHRQIDAYTDNHPDWRRSVERLAPERRRLGGIIVDVLYDHYLCRNWDKFSDRSLAAFAEFCYTSLLSRTQFMEQEPRRVVRRMREHDWLNSYQTVDGIEFAFERMSKRAPVLAEIHLAKDDFRESYDEFETDFLSFYPQLMDFAKESWQL
ncbi:MAG: ACP phosphodiesterase [Verrucomicrobiota bacterium]